LNLVSLISVDLPFCLQSNRQSSKSIILMRTGNGKKHWLKYLVFLIALQAIPAKRLYAQIIEAGFKSGFNYSWVRYDDRDWRKKTKTYPIPGYSLGGVVSFKVKDRYFLHTEYLFTTKGRINKTYIDKDAFIVDQVLRDRTRLYYMEIPVLYNVFFKGHLKAHGDRTFKYYAGGGPIFSYWLGGRGKIFSDQHLEGQLPADKYKIKFGTRNLDFQKRDEVYIPAPNRLQIGLAAGGGILTEPTTKNRIMIDFRIEYGHTWWAKSGEGADTEDIYFPVNYKPSLKVRNMGMRLSAIYAIELNTNKKVRNKGKSSLRKKLGQKK
jgi:hypothetical protein